MALYTSYTDQQISSLIVENCASVRRNTTYEQLPQYVRTVADEGKRIEALAASATGEYERSKQAIKGMADFNDPRKINDAFAVEFQGVVSLDTSRIIPVEFTDDQTIQIVSGTWPSVSSGYLDGFAVTFLDGGINLPVTQLQYRRITSSTQGSGVYTLSLDQAVENAYAQTHTIPAEPAIQFAYLSFPDRVDLPTALISDPRQDGTTLPTQDLRSQVASFGLSHSDPNKVVVVPNREYLVSVPEGAWDGWTLRMIDGAHAGTELVVEDHILYNGSHILSVGGELASIAQDDFFMLIPPADQFVSIAKNAYSGMYIRVGTTGPSDINYGTRGVPSQTRQILTSEFEPLSRPARSEAFIYNPFTDSGSEFEYPPPYNAKIGVSDTFVELAQLAEYLGIYLDDLDPEALQREQLASAYDFHRIRGTQEAIELLCRLRGFDTIVEENVSTFTPHPGFIFDSTSGASVSVDHKQFSEGSLPELVVPQDGRGVPRSYVTSAAGRAASRVPDSDISVYLERVNPLAIESSDAFIRLYRQLRDLAVPAHVDIIFFGLLQRFTNNVEIGQDLTVGCLSDIAVDIVNDLYSAPIGAAESVEALAAVISNSLLLISPQRYDTTVRWSNGVAANETGVSRWTSGNTRLM